MPLSFSVKNSTEVSPPAISDQQRRFAETGFTKYRQFVVGNVRFPVFLGFEAYNLFFAGLPGVLGFGFRQRILPYFLSHSGGKLIIGKDVTIRHPSKITLGKNVLLDDFAVLDIREEHDANANTASIQLDDHVLLGRNSILTAKSGRIHLHAGCNVGSQCRIATQSKIEIGESTLIAAYAYIGPGNHQMESSEQAIIEQAMENRGGVRIGRNCWIGTRATIVDGVTIGDNAIVGAHSFVRDNVPENAVVVGTPAKVIRIR